jgi:hypothetical protein
LTFIVCFDAIYTHFEHTSGLHDQHQRGAEALATMSGNDAEEEESEDDDTEIEADEDDNPPEDAASGDLDDITAGLAAASVSK